LPLATTDYADNIYWVYGLVAPDTNEKTRLTEHLKKKMIGYRPFFWSMHKQPVFHNMKLFLDETYPVAERLSETGIYLPSGLGLSHEIWKLCQKQSGRSMSKLQ
jgi:perosamine synthetase